MSHAPPFSRDAPATRRLDPARGKGIARNSAIRKSFGKSAFQILDARGASLAVRQAPGGTLLGRPESDLRWRSMASGSGRPMNDRLFPARPILAVSAAVFRAAGRSSSAERERRSSAISACPAAGSRSGRRLRKRSRASLWKRSASKPKSSLLTGMWRRSNTVAFCHRFVRRPTDKGRAALERRSRRRRLDRSGRPLASADDAGAWRSAYVRGADRKSRH